MNTHMLLDMGLVGLEDRLAIADSAIQKMESFHGVPGPLPKDYKPTFDAKRVKDDRIEMTMDRRFASVFRKVATIGRGEMSELRKHQYAMLVVYVWGAFETYIYMLFGELYRLRPELLKSKEQLTVENIVIHRDRILDLLIEKQLETLGHNSFAEHADYLQRRINYRFTKARRERLSGMYLVRNVIAHNSGLVRSDLRNKLPTGITIEGEELRINKNFLTKMINGIESAVISIEKHVETKFFSRSLAKS